MHRRSVPSNPAVSPERWTVGFSSSRIWRKAASSAAAAHPARGRQWHGSLGFLRLWSVLIGCLVSLSTLPAAEPTGAEAADPAAVLRGGQLARTYCVTCHLFPEPEALDRKTWMEQVLPRMKYRLGFSTAKLEQSPNIKLLREHHRIPLTPVISEAQWVDLITYYIVQSPEQSLPQESAGGIELGVPGFRAAPLAKRPGAPAVTAVKILPGGGAVWADAGAKEISWLARSGQVSRSVAMTNPISAFHWLPDGILAAGLGSFSPSDAPRGAVFWLTNAAAWQPAAPILSGLPRTSDVQYADLNGDGRPDYVVSCFGNNIGRLSWWENRVSGPLVEHELFGLPGTLRTVVADFNGDGHPDIAALVAQETEALFVFVGDGKGGFERRTVFQRPPYWGHSYFEVADFNGDGRLDFLVSNGDNGEFSAAAKRYHGVRIYLAQSGFQWREAAFLPMYGAYKAVARDFDHDGDLDLAAISYFPDYQRAPRGSFVYWRNDGGFRFPGFTFAESALGRWLTMDAGDFDGDGDDDLVLGSYIEGPTAVPAKLMKAWQEVGPPLMLLENLGRAAPGAGK